MTDTSTAALAAGGGDALDAAALLAAARERHDAYVRDLAHLVAADSGTWNAAGVDRAGSWCRARLDELGFTTERVDVGAVDGERLGGAVVGRRRGTGAGRVLLFGHLDTVFPDGTAALRPFRVEGGRAYGPGVSDDKGGVLAGLQAVEVLDAVGWSAYEEVVVALTPDEEVGAPGSRGLLESLAADVDVALCLECARENGDVVVARKGVADVRITVDGRAAHAGVEPDRGASAAVAAAHLVVAIDALNGARPGTTVNVGVVSAGTRPNVVAEQAVLDVEVRADTLVDLTTALDAVDAIAAAPAVPGTSAVVRRGEVCPPFERDAAVDRLLAEARAVAAELGLPLAGAATGGVSDANYTAAVGTPTLDGLGPVGGDDHSATEWLDLVSVPSRVALLAGLVARLTAPVPPPSQEVSCTVA